MSVSCWIAHSDTNIRLAFLPRFESGILSATQPTAERWASPMPSANCADGQPTPPLARSRRPRLSTVTLPWWRATGTISRHGVPILNPWRT